uniref:Uncharacterized protein n=1 Tax=Anopheles arabiensis TaxID=7173 RepID=A0A182HLS0_ANOAR
MWYLVLVAFSATLYFASKRWGRQLYYRWGRLIPFRRAIGNKSRPPTPPLIDTSVPAHLPAGGVSGSGEEGYPLLGGKEEFDDALFYRLARPKCPSVNYVSIIKVR